MQTAYIHVNSLQTSGQSTDTRKSYRHAKSLQASEHPRHVNSLDTRKAYRHVNSLRRCEKGLYTSYYPILNTALLKSEHILFSNNTMSHSHIPTLPHDTHPQP